MYDMIHPDEGDTSTVRSVFITDPDNKIRLSLTAPAFVDRNLIAILDDLGTARDLVSRGEFLEERVGDIGLVVLGTEDPALTPRTVLDAAGVLPDAGRKTLKGAIPGALVGAVLFGIVGAAIGGAPLAAGLAVGGAFFIGLSTAEWFYIIATRSTSAYEQSFVDSHVASLIAVSIHANDSRIIDRALEVLEKTGAIALSVDPDGTSRRLN